MLRNYICFNTVLLLGLVAAGLSRLSGGSLIYGCSTNFIDLGCNCG